MRLEGGICPHQERSGRGDVKCISLPYYLINPLPVFTDKGFLLVDFPQNEAINHLFPTYKLIFPTFLKVSDLFVYYNHQC